MPIVAPSRVPKMNVTDPMSAFGGSTPAPVQPQQKPASPNRHQRRANKASVFAQAVVCHQAGRVSEAEALYRRVIAGRADHIEAIANLGLALQQQGRLDEAIEMHLRALALMPDFANANMNLALALEAAGRLEEAVPAYRRTVTLLPQSAEMFNNLGVVLQKLGRHQEAVAEHAKAATVNSQFCDAYFNLSLALISLNRRPEAAAALRSAIQIKPGAAAYHTALGVVLNDLGESEAAVAAHRQAIALDPKLASSYLNLGVALESLGRLDEAAEAQRRAIANDPRSFKAYDNLGLVLKKLRRTDEALAAHHQAIAIAPEAEGPHFNLGILLATLGRVEEAIASHRRAVALKPDFAEAHFKLGDNLMKSGQFVAGWQEYEWRWKTKARVSDVYDLLTKPLWTGERLDGRTIMLHYEQGLGDTIQFMRYVRRVQTFGGHVVLLIQPALKRLLGHIEGVTVVSLLDTVPPFDVHCPLLSLPRVLRTELETVPAEVPYLRADPEAVDRWRRRLAGPGRSVGVVWAGNVMHVNDAERSMPIEKIGPLFDVPGIRLFSVQKDLRAGDTAFAATRGAGMTMLGEEFTDFTETAAALTALDLLITVDTSVCHLAGALGRPVWLLLPFASEWRWLTDRDDSPWYPSMRLFRQRIIGDWDELLTRVAAEVATPC